MVGIGDLRVSRLLVGFLRLLAGMTQTALGRAARVDQSLLSRYEHPAPARPATASSISRTAGPTHLTPM